MSISNCYEKPHAPRNVYNRQQLLSHQQINKTLVHPSLFAHKLTDNNIHRPNLQPRITRINNGIRTIGYARFISLIPEDERKNYRGCLPPKVNLNTSNRTFRKIIHTWRQNLRQFFPTTPKIDFKPKYAELKELYGCSNRKQVDRLLWQFLRPLRNHNKT